MKNKLLDLYAEILEICGINQDSEQKKRKNVIILKCLREFINKCERPAIWCFGEHTKVLMSDYIYDLKKVNYIIDENYSEKSSAGFKFIPKGQIEKFKIDGIIISSFKYREEIKEEILHINSTIKYLDIYEELAKSGIDCEMEYYRESHPYDFYRQINNNKLKFKNDNDIDSLIKLIKIFVKIKDFYCAIHYTKKLLEIKCDKSTKQLLFKLEEIYKLQLNVAQIIPDRNVLMICFDGLRRKDVRLLPELNKYIKNNMLYFDNAYSISTSTYESLIPAYSNCYDFNTRYYEKNTIKKNGCQFINDALKQDRNIYFYTDGMHFVENDQIKVIEECQTATQKIWDFIIDSCEEENGLFYIHFLYESHFSYPSPYIDIPVVAEGTNILFDYLPINGGKIKTDYDLQHKESLRYLDDVVSPFLKVLNTKIVLFADHGNIILNQNETLKDIKYPMLTFCSDLIEIPIAIKTNTGMVKRNSSLCSLSNINYFVCSLLKDEEINIKKVAFIKVQRSQIYNPDFKYLYKILGAEQGLLAFELFIFENGYKIVIYSDGKIELYLDENKINKIEMQQYLYNVVKDYVTVVRR